MSSGNPGKRRVACRALLLAAGALAFAAAAEAQETGLRGAVSETSVTRGLLDGEQTALEQPVATDTVVVQRNPSPYEPVSPGAVPDENAPPRAADGRRLPAEPQAAETAEEPEQRALPPSTARARSEARRPRTTAAGEEAGEDETTPRRRTTAAAPEEEEEAQDELSTGTVRAGSVDSEVELRQDRQAERIEAIEDLDPEPLEENPYQAPGVRVGTFILRPSLETGIGWTSNADSSPDGDQAWFSESTLRLNGESDWAENRATFDAFGTYRKSISGAEIDDTNIGANGTLELLLSHEFRLLGEASYLRGPEAASSPVVIVGTLSRPIRQIFTGSLGLEKNAGKFLFGVTGSVEHQRFGDAELSTGGSLSQADRNFTLATAALRGGYEISPSVTPFVEVEVGRRLYEQALDSAGYDRSANRVAARAGVELDFTEKLAGELRAGWLIEKPDDARLASIQGFTLDGDLRWSPVRGTIVSLNGITIVEGTTTPGESGSILYSARLNLERQMRANLTGNVALGAGYRDYAGSSDRDTIFSAEAGMTWWFNRYLGLTGRARYETLDSTLPDRDSKTTTVFLGIRLQR